MKRIDQVKRDEVIRLFFYGYSYDEIMGRLDIGKGSVVNIIEEFRDGTLPVPPDLMTYIDELRYIAVDLKRLHTSPKEMGSNFRIHSKLLEMKVSDRDIESCLDICQSIANPDTTREQLVGTALEVARITKEKGISYNELLQDYDLKLKQLQDIEDKKEEIKLILQLKEEELGELQSEIEKQFARVASHLQKKKQPILLHHCTSEFYHGVNVNKHYELPVKQTTGHCINHH